MRGTFGHSRTLQQKLKPFGDLSAKQLKQS